MWLDELCYRGELAWLRLTPPTTPAKANSMAPRKATPITLVFREDLHWLLAAARTNSPECPEAGPVQEIADILQSQGASFLPDLADATHRLPDDIERALWNGVALGLFTADGFAAVRALLNRSSRRPTRHRPGQNLRSQALRTRATPYESRLKQWRVWRNPRRPRPLVPRSPTRRAPRRRLGRGRRPATAGLLGRGIPQPRPPPGHPHGHPVARHPQGPSPIRRPRPS